MKPHGPHRDWHDSATLGPPESVSPDAALRGQGGHRMIPSGPGTHEPLTASQVLSTQARTHQGMAERTAARARLAGTMRAPASRQA